MSDIHKTAIPEAVVTQIHDHLTAAFQAARPYFVTLTPQERHSMPKMGDKSLAFVEKAYAYAKDNPNLVQSFLDMAAFGADFKDAHDLFPIAALARQFADALEDVKLVAGSEAYHDGLAVYHNAQFLEKAGVPGIATIVDDLGERFAHGKPRTGETETETVTETIKKQVKIG